MSARSQAPFRVAAAAVVAIGAWNAALPAQQSPAPQAQAAPPRSPGPTSAEHYMNIQVLKDLPASQLHDAMVFMGASLGANCAFCHVRTPQGEWAFDKDDKPEKKTARQMLRMTQGLNAQYFDGKPTVTCSSCHQARHEPNPQPPIAQPFTADQLATMASRTPNQRPAAPTETADQVIARYLQAIGGEERLRAVSSATMRGTVTNRAGQVSPVLVEEAAPNLYRSSVDSKPAMTLAYDGTAAWRQAGGNARDLEGVEVEYASRLSGLGLALRLKDTYTKLAVGRYDRLDGRDVIWLNGEPSPVVMETLAFDRALGLLVRRLVRLQTAFGRLPLQVDYADYRDVDGVKVPFEVRITDWENAQTQKFADVTLNRSIDGARFKAPK